MGLAVEAVELTKQFGSFRAVDGVSFSVDRGCIFGFLGPNGAGKTTTIRMLLGLVKPTSGAARVLGLDSARQRSRTVRRIGYMSQRFSLYDDLTVDENLSFYGHIYGVQGSLLRRRKEAVLQMADLQGRRHVVAGHLAGGWKQRLALGASVLHEPEVLFLDEPTAGVDPVSRRAFWELLYDLSAGGTTIVLTTHYMDEAEHCQTLAFIQHGRIVAEGAPALVKDTYMPGRVLEIDCAQPPEAMRYLRASGRFDDVSMYGALIHAVAPNVDEAMPIVEADLRRAGLELRSLSIIPPSLEDVFLASLNRPGGKALQGLPTEAGAAQTDEGS